MTRRFAATATHHVKRFLVHGFGSFFFFSISFSFDLFARAHTHNKHKAAATTNLLSTGDERDKEMKKGREKEKKRAKRQTARECTRSRLHTQNETKQNEIIYLCGAVNQSHCISCERTKQPKRNVQTQNEADAETEKVNEMFLWFTERPVPTHVPFWRDFAGTLSRLPWKWQK